MRKRTIAMTVAAGMVALGAVLALLGFALSGFDVRVFTMQVDRGTAELGGKRVEHPEELPILEKFVRMGMVEVGGEEGADSPEAPDAPEAPVAPEAPAAPEAPTAHEASAVA